LNLLGREILSCIARKLVFLGAAVGFEIAAAGRLAISTTSAATSSFEFDLGTLELKKDGVRRRLEDKPAKALACLLERTGGVVDRADLIKALWPEESHGDFDHRLNKAINKLRFMLGDDSSAPRFIQTLSRRGYRIVGEVRIVEASPSVVAVPPVAGSVAETVRPDTAEVPTDPAFSGPNRVSPIQELDAVRSTHWWGSRSLSRRAAIATLAVAVCLLIGVGGNVWRS
jgi:DNA-binding winged helix-turn-helix (wHTH) protein